MNILIFADMVICLFSCRLAAKRDRKLEFSGKEGEARLPSNCTLIKVCVRVRPVTERKSSAHQLNHPETLVVNNRFDHIRACSHDREIRNNISINVAVLHGLDVSQERR